MRVAAFTDSYLPTVNGVTYTVAEYHDRWNQGYGRMDVVYPEDGHDPVATEHPVPSIPFPPYDGYRLGAPRLPDLPESDVVHVHTPFGLGLAALRLAGRADAPLVASYHTPAGEYVPYLSARFADPLRGLAERYERWFYDHADLVLAPSETTRRHVRELGVSTPVRVLPNGVDTGTFRPSGGAAFRERYDLGDGPLVGYTGRHGHEKRLPELLAAAEGLAADREITLVLAGDGPAREALESRAKRLSLPVRFLGFLERAELPGFYSALDVFGFPSPVETQGLVALEATACGIPVVGVDRGALRETIEAGETGYRYPPGDDEAFARALERALDEGDRLERECLARREDLDVGCSLRRLEEIYESL